LSRPTIGNRIGARRGHAGPACHNSSRPSLFFNEHSSAPSALIIAEMPSLWSVCFTILLVLCSGEAVASSYRETWPARDFFDEPFWVI
jgi:hypothetical protein